MNTLKKTMCLAALLLGLTGNTLAAEPSASPEEKPAAEVQTEKKSPSETLSAPALELASAIGNMTADESGMYTIDGQGKFPLVGKVLAHNVIYAKKNPTQAKSVMTVTVDGNRSAESYAYAEESKDGKDLIIYIENNKNGKEQWLKQTVPMSVYERAGDAGSAAVDNFMKSVKSVKKDYKNQYAVEFDVSGVYKPGDEKKWDKLSADQKKTVAAVLSAIAKQGSITANVSIDKKANRITKMALPLTDTVRNVGNAFLDTLQGDEGTKLLMKGLLSQSELDMAIAFDALPKDTDFTIPEKVRKEAVEEKK